MLKALIKHLREDVTKIEEPKAEALLGLKSAFEYYEKKNEKAWQKP